jgi:RNA polymerase sigma factor (sigma-70 family)
VQEGKHPSESYDLPAAEPLCAEAERALTLSIEQTIDGLRPRFTDQIHRFLRNNYHSPLTPSNLAHLERVGFRSALVALETSSGRAEDFPLFLAKSLQLKLGKLGQDSSDTDEQRPPPRRTAARKQDVPSEAIELTTDDLAEVAAALSAIRSVIQQLTAVHATIPVSLARVYIGRGVAQDDLRQEAYLGLRKAILNYQSTTNVPLSAFAKTVIRRHLLDVTRAAHDGNSHTGRDIADFYDANVRLGNRFGRQPTNDEIGTELAMTEKQFSKVLAIRAAVEMQPLPSTDEGSIFARADDPNEEGVTPPQLLAAIENLPPQQREVIMLRFSQGVTTFKEVADKLDITDEKARYRCRLALASLRKSLGIPMPATRASRHA